MTPSTWSCTNGHTWISPRPQEWGADMHRRTPQEEEGGGEVTWTEHAACRGLPTRLFYPDRGHNPHAAKMVCARCPVTAECAAAGTTETHGVWAGTTPVERHGKTAHNRGDNRRLHEVAVCPQCDTRWWVHQARAGQSDPCHTCRMTGAA